MALALGSRVHVGPAWREGVFGFVIQPLVAKDGRVHGLLHVGAVVD